MPDIATAQAEGQKTREKGWLKGEIVQEQHATAGSEG